VKFKSQSPILCNVTFLIVKYYSKRKYKFRTWPDKWTVGNCASY